MSCNCEPGLTPDVNGKLELSFSFAFLSNYECDEFIPVSPTKRFHNFPLRIDLCGSVFVCGPRGESRPASNTGCDCAVSSSTKPQVPWLYSFYRGSFNSPHLIIRHPPVALRQQRRSGGGSELSIRLLRVRKFRQHSVRCDGPQIDSASGA